MLACGHTFDDLLAALNSYLRLVPSTEGTSTLASWLLDDCTGMKCTLLEKVKRAPDCDSSKSHHLRDVTCAPSSAHHCMRTIICAPLSAHHCLRVIACKSSPVSSHMINYLRFHACKSLPARCHLRFIIFESSPVSYHLWVIICESLSASDHSWVIICELWSTCAGNKKHRRWQRKMREKLDQ